MIAAEVVQNFLDRVEDADERLPGADTSLSEIIERWQAIGVRPGDLVLLCLPNGKSLLQQFFGAMLAGGVPALVAPNTPSLRLESLVKALGARALLSVRPPPETTCGPLVERIAGAYAYRSGFDGPPTGSAGDVAMLTSGTSGFATGCLFDISALLLNAERHAQAIGQRTDDTVLINLPLHFSFALVAQALASFIRGNRLLISGPPFHSPTYVKTLTRGVTISSLTPLLVRSLNEVSLPGSLRVLSIGGDHLPPGSVADLLKRRPGGELYLTYGLTQAGPRVSTLAAHAEPSARHASVGRPHPGTTVYLENVGESSGLKQLFVSSATVMKRVIGLPDGDKQVTQLVRGSIATGDVFEEDSEGYLYFKGRISDFIVRNGEKVCLSAIRRVAMSCPNVIRASTVVSRHNGTQDFELILHMAPGATDLSSDVLRRWLRQSEMPRSIRVVTAEEAVPSAYK